MLVIALSGQLCLIFIARRLPSETMTYFPLTWRKPIKCEIMCALLGRCCTQPAPVVRILTLDLSLLLSHPVVTTHSVAGLSDQARPDAHRPLQRPSEFLPHSSRLLVRLIHLPFWNYFRRLTSFTHEQHLYPTDFLRNLLREQWTLSHQLH